MKNYVPTFTQFLRENVTMRPPSDLDNIITPEMQADMMLPDGEYYIGDPGHILKDFSNAPYEQVTMIDGRVCMLFHTVNQRGQGSDGVYNVMHKFKNPEYHGAELYTDTATIAIIQLLDNDYDDYFLSDGIVLDISMQPVFFQTGLFFDLKKEGLTVFLKQGSMEQNRREYEKATKL